MDFKERDALHYVVYDLEPLVRAALVAKSQGQDWLKLSGKDGQTLEAGLNWLLPYAKGEKTHQEFAHTTKRFDVARGNAGVGGFTGEWVRIRRPTCTGRQRFLTRVTLILPAPFRLTHRNGSGLTALRAGSRRHVKHRRSRIQLDTGEEDKWWADGSYSGSTAFAMLPVTTRYFRFALYVTFSLPPP